MPVPIEILDTPDRRARTRSEILGPARPGAADPPQGGPSSSSAGTRLGRDDGVHLRVVVRDPQRRLVQSAARVGCVDTVHRGLRSDHGPQRRHKSPCLLHGRLIPRTAGSLGVVAFPARRVPQLDMHQPLVFGIWLLIVAASVACVIFGIIAGGRRKTVSTPDFAQHHRAATSGAERKES